MLLTDRLLKELNLHYFARRDAEVAATADSAPAIHAQAETAPQVQLSKDEFRLLVKMLQAIGHEVSVDGLSYQGDVLTYSLSDQLLIFDDVNKPDNDQTIHLAGLHALLNDASLKRPVWEKLKQLK